MVKRDQYRIDDPTITIAAAANFIADHVPIKKSRQLAYEGAYSVITYAREVGRLPNQPSMSALTFFSWAVSRKEWKALEKVPGLKFSTDVMVSGVATAASVGVSYAVDVPDDVASLKAIVSELTARLEQAERELSEKQAALEACLSRKRKRSAAAAEFGKMGGRGNAR
jgi:hypothetical protein